MYSCRIVRRQRRKRSGSWRGALRAQSRRRSGSASCAAGRPRLLRQREEDEGQEVERPEQCDPEGARVEHDDRDEADGEVVDRGTELADRLGGPGSGSRGPASVRPGRSLDIPPSRGSPVGASNRANVKTCISPSGSSAISKCATRRASRFSKRGTSRGDGRACRMAEVSLSTRAAIGSSAAGRSMVAAIASRRRSSGGGSSVLRTKRRATRP